MALSYTYNGGALTHKVPPSLISIPQRAENGEPSFGGIPIEDPTATLVMLGHRPFIVAESACAQPRLFTGYVAQRDMGRSYEQTQWVGADPRLFDTTIVDQNAIFGFRIIWDTDGNRPEETWDARLAWILGSDYMSGLFGGDTTFIDSHVNPMDAADYRGSTPGAVFNDLIQRFDGAMNYFAFWNPTTSAVEIAVFGIDEVTAACTLSISNLESEIDASTVFAPDMVAKLAREPDQVYSDVIVEYANGKVHRTLESTATKYIKRGTTISRPYTGKASTAAAQGDQFLLSHSVERDRITCVMQSVPAASVGLVRAGMSMDVRFTHLPDYAADFVTMRIVACSPVPVNDKGDIWDISLELVGGIPAIPTESAFAVLTWGCSDNYVYDWAISSFPWKVSHRHNGDNFQSGDGPPFDVGLSGPLEYVDAAGDPSPGPYSDGDRGYGIKCLADGIVDVEFAQTGIAVNNTGMDIDIYLNGASVASAHTDDSIAGAIVTKSDLAVVAGDIIWGYITAIYGSINLSVPAGAGNASTEHLMVSGIMGSTPTGVDIPTPVTPETTTHTTDPTVDDDEAHGFSVGDHWVNTTDGSEWVLVDATTGAAVWVSTTYVTTWNFSTSDGVTTVDPTVELTFVGATLADLGSGVAEVTVAATNAVTNIDGGKEVVNTVAAAGAAETLDLADGNLHDVTLTADCTFTFAGTTAGVACSFTLLLRQDGTGGWTTTWPGSVIWAGGTAPTLDETASTVAVLTFFTIDGGTNWYGFPTGGGGTPATTVESETTLGIAAAVGNDTEYARQDHTHGSPSTAVISAAGFVGPILISDTPSTPLVFADLIQNEAEDDLVYADI